MVKTNMDMQTNVLISDARKNALAGILSRSMGMTMTQETPAIDINLPNKTETKDGKKRAKLNEKITRIDGITNAFNYLENTMYPIETFILNDTEGKSSLDSDDQNGLLTLDGHKVFVHGCKINNQRYFLNNSKTPICHDYKKQIKPIMDQIKGNLDSIENISIRHYRDTRFYIDITTKIRETYHNDNRGDGSFSQHIYVEGALSSEKAWDLGIMMYRLVCSNGMFALSKANVASKHKNAGFDISNMNLANMNQFHIFDLLQGVDMPSNIHDIMAQLPKKYQKVILEQAAIEGHPTAFALYQGMAYMLSNTELDDRTKEQYELYCKIALNEIIPKTGELFNLIGHHVKSANADETTRQSMMY